MRVSNSNNPIQGSEISHAGKAGKADATKDAKRVDRAKVGDAETASAGRSSGGARAEISAKGREFAAAKAVADGAPDVREEKIAELKRKIAAGQYKVDADAVADRMVDDHIRMSGIG